MHPLLCGFVLIVFTYGSAARSSLETVKEIFDVATNSVTHPKNDCNITSKVAFLDEIVRVSYPSTDGASILKALTKCTRDQRVAIVATYNAQYRHDFLSLIYSQCDYWTYYIISSLARTLPEFWARELNWAVKGPGTDEEAIIQILTPLNHDQVTELKNKYTEIFNSDLRDDVLDDIGGDFAEIADSQIRGVRKENTDVNGTAAAIVARKLREAGLKGELGIHNPLFYETITQMSFPRLRKVHEELLRLNYDIQDAMEKKFNGWDLRAYTAIIKFAEGKAAFFVDAMKRASDAQDIRATLRIMTWRFDIDINIIKTSNSGYVPVSAANTSPELN